MDKADETAARVAAVDQAKAEASDFAATIVTFRKVLVDGGFEEADASVMAAHWFQHQLLLGRIAVQANA